MIYVKHHAIKRYTERIPNSTKDNKKIRDKILDVVLNYEKLISKKGSKEKAYIKNNIVAITKKEGIDEIVLTIEPISYTNCWWNKKGKGAC